MKIDLVHVNDEWVWKQYVTSSRHYLHQWSNEEEETNVHEEERRGMGCSFDADWDVVVWWWMK